MMSWSGNKAKEANGKNAFNTQGTKKVRQACCCLFAFSFLDHDSSSESLRCITSRALITTPGAAMTFFTHKFFSTFLFNVQYTQDETVARVFRLAAHGPRL
jgi:hypothetical protein